MKRVGLSLLTLTLLLAMAGTALATPITYTESVVGSGTLGNQRFVDALVTISWTGDTANVQDLGGFFQNNAAPGAVLLTIAGIGSAHFTDNLYVFDNQGAAAVGFADADLAGSILDTFDNAFASYDLRTAIGPITNGSFIRPDLFFGTDGGAFNLQSAGNSTFTATTETGVPEPATLSLLGIGLVGALRRKLTS